MGAPAPLLLLWVQAVSAGSHVFRGLYSALSSPLPGLPQFFAVNLVDDVEILRFPGESRRADPLVPWMKKINSEEPDYWELSTGLLRGHEQATRSNVKTMMNRVNQTGGLHIIQLTFGCELRDDGSIGGFDQWAFDGRDLISFNKDQLTFTAASEPARVTQERWNSDWSIIDQEKAYLEGTCIKYLRKYLEYGKESLTRKVRPEAKVSRRMTGACTTLTCYAYGFYPREIEVKWVRNGVEMPWKSKTILPNPDGTYQAQTTVEVHEEDDERIYTCQVEHSSLEEILIVYVPTEDKSSSAVNIRVVAGVVTGVLLLLVAVAGVITWMKKRTVNVDYVPPGTGPDPCDSCPV